MLILSSSNAFNLDLSEKLSFGKGLKAQQLTKTNAGLYSLLLNDKILDKSEFLLTVF